MIDDYDASHDRLRLAVARGVEGYDEDQLFDCLADPDPILRTAAARKLHIRGTRSSFDRAVNLLDKPRYEMREIGAFVLGQLGTPECPFADEAHTLLERLLNDEYGEVRAAAIGAMGSLACLGHGPPPQLVHKLHHLLGEELAALELHLADPAGPLVRARLAFAFGAIKGSSQRDALLFLLDDPDPEVRDTAELGLEMHDEERVRMGEEAQGSALARAG